MRPTAAGPATDEPADHSVAMPAPAKSEVTSIGSGLMTSCGLEVA